jgi:2-hydroxychromene-2-carboxylate isomerase
MTTLECFFDCSSPWSYLAFHNLQPLAHEYGLAITWRPTLVGGIFNAINPSVYESRANPVDVKARYLEKDIGDWARIAGLSIKYRPSVFPVNSVKAMRGCLLLESHGKLVPFARTVFEIYWREDRDISQDSVLADACRRIDVDSTWFFTGIAEPAVKDRLRDNTNRRFSSITQICISAMTACR